MIHFACPTCRKVLQYPDENSGQKIACPGCGQRLMIPAGINSPSTSPVNKPPHAIAEQPSAPSPFAFSGGAEVPARQRISGGWARRLISPSFLVFVVLILPLPWMEIRCSAGAAAGKTLVTQSGFQTIYGGYSPDRQLKALAEQRDRELAALLPPAEFARAKADAEKDRLRVSAAPLMVMFALALPVALVISFGSCFAGKLSPQVSALSGAVIVVMFLLLSLQVAIGFPLEGAFESKLTENRTKRPGSFDDDHAGQMMAAMMFETRSTLWPYVALAFVFFSLAANGGNLIWDIRGVLSTPRPRAP